MAMIVDGTARLPHDPWPPELTVDVKAKIGSRYRTIRWRFSEPGVPENVVAGRLKPIMWARGADVSAKGASLTTSVLTGVAKGISKAIADRMVEELEAIRDDLEKAGPGFLDQA